MVEKAANGKRLTGRIKFFDMRKGFGFICPNDGSEDVFLGLKALPPDCKALLPDQQCSFIRAESKRGPLAQEFKLV